MFQKSKQWLKSLNAVEKVKSEYSDPNYSVLIHFTPQASYVYVLEDESFFVQYGFASITVEMNDEGRMKIEVSGSYVIGNKLGTWEEAKAFIDRYQMPNPVFMTTPVDDPLKREAMCNV